MAPMQILRIKKNQMSFRAKRGIFAGADSYVTLEDFSRWSK
jgi:hypothetical protein